MPTEYSGLHKNPAPTPRMGDLPALRLQMAEAGTALPRPSLRTREFTVGSVPLRLYEPPRAIAPSEAGNPLLVFLHGGGWVLGDLDSHDACCRHLCINASCAILAVGYRLAPEHPFPAALEDTVAAVAWARSNAADIGCDPARIAIGGESAGANLAAAATLSLRDRQQAPPLFQLLVHPPTDLTMSQPSIRQVDLPGLPLAFLEQCIAAYAGGAAIEDPLLSPLLSSDLSGLPPAIVITVEHDPLRDDGEHYALALARAGSPVSLHRLPGLPHGFMFLPTTLPEIADAYRLLGTQIASYSRPA